MENYFGMDSFSRGATEIAYCANNVKNKEIDILSQTAVAPIKYLNMDGLTTYHNLNQEQIKKLENRVAALEEKMFRTSKTSFAFVHRLKRADLNLVFS